MRYPAIMKKSYNAIEHMLNALYYKQKPRMDVLWRHEGNRILLFILYFI